MVRAPFEVIYVENTDPAQATHTKLFIAGCGVNRQRVYAGSGSKTRILNTWGYVRHSYLGSFSLSFNTRKWEWRGL